MATYDHAWLNAPGDAPRHRPNLLERVLIASLSRGARKKEGVPMNVGADRAKGDFMTSDRLVPRGVKRTEEVIAGVPVVRSTSGSSDRGTVLYFHGGAYVTGSAKSIGVPVAAKGGPDVVSVEYRLSPEHPYPAGQNDAMAVYRSLLESVGPDRLMVMGDSAGGGLTLTLIQEVAAAGLPMPAGIMPIYPWGDLSASSPSWQSNKGKDILVHSQVSESARWYAGDLDLRDPLVSPMFGSFVGFPPTYMVVGTRDLLVDDAKYIERRMSQDGVPVRLDVFEGAPHGFNGVPTAGGRDCNRRIRRFIDAVLPPR
jgi:monoterpene epsilon-lactone hydrolase